uniref:Glyoxalase/fosfomycin resistance/dioxygenase domain-containing protein n=1 Tax=Stomoxys calcitrans TaxID=35570 RepID=A0A1I8NNA4_STOCA
MADYTCLTDTEAGEICNHRDAATKDFVFIHTMYRIKDPRKTLSFYGRVLGMTLLQKVDFPDGRFSLYFLGFEGSSDFKRGTLDHIKWVMSRQATLELTQ